MLLKGFLSEQSAVTLVVLICYWSLLLSQWVLCAQLRPLRCAQLRTPSLLDCYMCAIAHTVRHLCVSHTTVWQPLHILLRIFQVSGRFFVGLVPGPDPRFANSRSYGSVLIRWESSASTQTPQETLTRRGAKNDTGSGPWIRPGVGVSQCQRIANGGRSRCASLTASDGVALRRGVVHQGVPRASVDPSHAPALGIVGGARAAVTHLVQKC